MISAKRIDETPEDANQWPWPKLQPGEYGKSLDGTWKCIAPVAHEDHFDDLVGNLASHKIIEHEDGTITVSPSILIGDRKNSWHGYLENGVWREC